jgi:hypothetical protein
MEIINTVENRFKSSPHFLRNSLCQYECHRHCFFVILWFGFQVFSCLIIGPIFFVLLARSLMVKSRKKISNICLYPFIPKSIRDQFSPVFVKKPFGCLKRRDWPFIRLILCSAGVVRPYFALRCIWKLAIYSELIETYSPEKIWVTQEMVFESSLITSYLENFGIKHINFMHGQHNFSIRIAFSTFDQNFVWDKYYIELFKSLNMRAKSYHVFSPLEKSTSTWSQKNIIKYYAQRSDNKVHFSATLKNLLSFAERAGCELVVRLHPLHQTNYERKVLVAHGVRIENNQVCIVDSVVEATYVCSEFSSVLYFASLLDRKIVVDNSNQKRFERVQDLEPIFLKKISYQCLVT